MSKGIQLSDKHGVNPMMTICYLCGESDNGIALLGKLKGDAEAPREGCINREPCDSCKGHMKTGIILISVRDGQGGSDNPYRTGGWVVIKQSAIERMMSDEPELLAKIVKARMAWVPDDVWDAIPLPRGPIDGAETGTTTEGVKT